MDYPPVFVPNLTVPYHALIFYIVLQQKAYKDVPTSSWNLIECYGQ